ncbi:MAG: tetratricopeptide repeat protein [Bacteroidia bacterium]|nr:tetratricopeptide repeat protein [Bacteroidia bacterium]MDW8332619.1 tetratricopeptide repeat protein [Bacteroidia bacterium]
MTRWFGRAWPWTAAAILTWAVGCKAGGKAKTGGKGAGKGYHTMTSLFNGYYHADKLYKEGMANAEKNVKIPPSGFLPLIPTKDQVVKASQFDRAVEKCDVIIFRHKKGDYVDDCYFLKGKCAFQKGEYFDAVVNFNYIGVKYPDSPLILQVKLWQAKCAYAQDNAFRAKRLLEEALREDAAARAKGKTKVSVETAPVKKAKGKKSKKSAKSRTRKVKPPRLPGAAKADVAELYCTLAIGDGDYRGALKTLHENKRSVKRQKKRLARWEFLTAQLYEHLAGVEKNPILADSAAIHYRRVINLNTNNDLTFRAKLNLAQIYIDHSPEGTDLETVLKPLYKLLKDPKFEDYYDQIYYRLALLEQKNKQTDKALGYYRKSAAVSTNNTAQKALSYYKAGHIYFYHKHDLDSALAYYDSSAAIAPKSMPEYEDVVSMSDVLKRFDQYRKTIKTQDSLLKLSKLSDEALRAEIDKIVEKEEKERIEKKKKQEAEQQQALSGMMRDQRMDQRNQALTASAAFYFDDPSQVERGKAIFQQNWGRRPNEDDWRRRNKQSKSKTASQDASEENLDELEGEELKKALEKKKERYFKNVPRTPEEIKAAEDKLREAMYELARLYSQRLNQPEKSIETYVKITQRFAGHPIVPEAYYGAYLVCEDVKHRDAKKYRDIILTQFPNSIYARLIRKEATRESTGDSFEELYHTLFDLYEKQDYKTALQFSDYLLEKHIAHPDIAKVFYLRGMCFGYGGQMDSLRSIFKYLTQNFPDDEVSKLAQKTLAYIDGTGVAQTPEQTASKNAKVENKSASNPNFSGFGPRKSGEPVVVVMLVAENLIKQKDLETTLTDMHQALFAGQSLRASVFIYHDPQKGNHHLAYVNQFAGAKAADEYLKTAQNWEGLKGLFNKFEDEAFFMAASNFRTAFSQKRMHHYVEYYKANKQRMLNEE